MIMFSMKKIEQLEKEFDDKIWMMDVSDPIDAKELKNYIFQELLPQVLSEIIPDFDNFDRVWIDRSYEYQTNIILWEKQYLEKLKQKAKEMWINLSE